jgi:hypothetical protein
MPLLIGPINPTSSAGLGIGTSGTSGKIGISSGAGEPTANDETHNRGHYESADEKRNNLINGRTYAEVAADHDNDTDSDY